MSEAKKKKTTKVRTRVVSSDEASSSKTKSKTSTSKVSSQKKATADSKPKQSLRDKIKSRKNRKESNKPQKELGYFKGAWYELKQVRWPNRKATWSLTIAVILFTLFFVILVLLLDAGFKYLFDLVIK